ncbi:hypothetical protein Tco_0440156 [Tanacetum coccineum]
MESDISSGDETLSDSTYEKFQKEKHTSSLHLQMGDSDDEETDFQKVKRKLLLTQRIAKHLLKTGHQTVKTVLVKNLGQRDLGTKGPLPPKRKYRCKEVQNLSSEDLKLYMMSLTNHKGSATCLLLVSYLQEEPKKVSLALADESWVEGIARKTASIKLQELPRIGSNEVSFLALHLSWALLSSDGCQKCIFVLATSLKWYIVKQPPGFEDHGSSKQGLTELSGLYGMHQAQEHDIMFAVCLCARFQVTPKVSHMHAVKRIFRYLTHQLKLGLWYPKDSPFHLEAFSDSDYAGDNHDRRSTSGGCQYLGRRLVSWQCKKQTIVAISSTEAEYVAAASCCAQVLWMQNQLQDYGFNFKNTEIHIDNESTICIMKNPVLHSKTKHIQIRHHFIRDCYEQRLINVVKVHTDDNVADLLTKGFDLARFNFLVVTIGMMNP